nr:retrovirus-related Pol polyprotein from transposon TNT 1-94 [Tanacetum cinerariifolium]
MNEPIVSEPTVKKLVVKTSEAKASADKAKDVRKNFGSLLIEDWISDSEDEAELKPNIEKKIVKPSFAKIEFVKSKVQVKSPRKTTLNLEEFMNEPIVSEPTVKKPVVETSEDKASADKPKDVRKNFGSPLIEDWISDSKDEAESKPNIKKKAVKPSYGKIEFVKSKAQVKSPRKTTLNLGQMSNRHWMLKEHDMEHVLSSYEEIDEGYVAFGGNPKGGKITRKEAVNTACYVQNRVLVIKPHNNTSYELFHGRIALSFMRPFGYPVTILNTKDNLGKFDGKADEGFFVRYSLRSKAFRVFNSRTRMVEENLHIRSSYKEEKTCQRLHFLPLWTVDPLFSQDPKSYQDDGFQPTSDNGKKVDEDPSKGSECRDQEQKVNVNRTNNVNVAGINEVNIVGANTNNKLSFDPEMPSLEDISTFNFSNDHEDADEEAA